MIKFFLKFIYLVEFIHYIITFIITFYMEFISEELYYIYTIHRKLCLKTIERCINMKPGSEVILSNIWITINILSVLIEIYLYSIWYL